MSYLICDYCDTNGYDFICVRCNSCEHYCKQCKPYLTHLLKNKLNELSDIPSGSNNQIYKTGRDENNPKE